MSTQLDIFDDGRDVMLRNDIAQALVRGDHSAGWQAVAALRLEFPQDPALGAAHTLLHHIDPGAGAAAPPEARQSAADIMRQRAHIEQTLAPAAQALMGRDLARGWLQAQWRALAQRATHVPWQAADASAHAAALYLQAGDWAAVVDAAQAIASWRRIPQPLMWMAEARWMGQGPEAAWPLLAEALWLAPGPARAVMQRLLAQRPDRLVARLLSGFDAAFDPERERDWAWLPAWVLIERPELAAVLADAGGDAADLAEKPAVQGFKLLMALLRLERAGRHHEIVAHRRQLQGLNERLFGLYMRTR